MSDKIVVSEELDGTDNDKENREGNPIERKHLDKIRDATLKVQTKKMLRKIPRDILSVEWLTSIASAAPTSSSSSSTAETLVFLTDEVIPCLTLALERLLIEISRRGLDGRPELKPDVDGNRIRFEDGVDMRAAKKDDPEVTAFKGVFDVNFNPINFVAQFLMRHNPKFSVQRLGGNEEEEEEQDGSDERNARLTSSSSSSSYVRSLKEISGELKNKMAEEKLAPQKGGRRREEENPAVATRRVTMWM